MTEEELLRTAARLGEAEVRELDGQRIARRVLARLESEPVVAVRPLQRTARTLLLGLAAAAAILLALRLTTGTGGGPAAPTSLSSASVLSELDELSAGELELLLETLPPADSVAHPDPTAIEALDVKSLERLLRSLEG